MANELQIANDFKWNIFLLHEIFVCGIFNFRNGFLPKVSVRIVRYANALNCFGF